MPEIAAVGDEVSLLPFRALGVKSFLAEGSERAEEIVRELSARTPPFAAILITEKLAESIMSELSAMAREGQVPISFIPGASGSMGLGTEKMRGLVRRAIGVDL